MQLFIEKGLRLEKNLRKSTLNSKIVKKQLHSLIDYGIILLVSNPMSLKNE